MKYSEYHWKFFNFLTRRLMALSFIVGGIILTMYGLQCILPGGTVLVDGIPTDDLVFRWVVFLLPLIGVLLGIASYRVAPFEPQKK